MPAISKRLNRAFVMLGLVSAMLLALSGNATAAVPDIAPTAICPRNIYGIGANAGVVVGC